jgi:hypothetical protein
MGVRALVHGSNVDANRMYGFYVRSPTQSLTTKLDDSAAHIAEETSNAARAAPVAILTSVVFTSLFGWIFLIAGWSSNPFKNVIIILTSCSFVCDCVGF